MENQEYPYLRIGTSIMKIVERPLLSGDVLETIIPWSIENIKQDHGKAWNDVIEDMPRFDGFCTIPDHINYQRKYGSFYNVYEPITHFPNEGECQTILTFITHIFGEQIELGLDYLQLLYQQPVERLPVLCLVSSQRNTGKTTFLNFLKAIFGKNFTFNTNEDFRSNFNSDWVSKLIIGIDEVFLDRKEDSERVKNLSTAKSYKSEAKGKDRFEVEFFGKLIFCSNNEENFIKISPEETRYWVRKVPSLQEQDPNLLQKLIKEIPYFLQYLNQRKLSSTKESRMWFSPRTLETDALRRLKSQNLSKDDLELLETMKEIIDAMQLTEICITNTQAQSFLQRSGIRVSRSRVRKILEENWDLIQHPNSANYTSYSFNSSGQIIVSEAKGRYYKIASEKIDQIFDDLLT